MSNADSRSFEGRVFARFDDLDARLQKSEARAFDTKPIWEQALKEIVETKRELSKHLDRIEASAHETRAGVRDAEDRIEKLESKPSAQVARRSRFAAHAV
jgi:septal ring factor EnvC (AmiA/AmiB activator)